MQTISVVIPTYNRRNFVTQAIESVLRQTRAPHEIVVVDDGSSDDTASVLAVYGECIRYIQQRNAGKSNARNTGIRAATGTHVAFLDSDDLWEPNRIDVLHRVLEVAEADAGLFFTNYSELLDDGTLRASSNEDKVIFSIFRHYPFRMTEMLPDARRIGEIEYRQGRVAPYLFFGNFIHTTTSLCRRSAVLEVGGFNDRYGFGEDWDLWLRIARRHPCVYIDVPTAIYRLHDEQAIKTTSTRHIADTIVEVVEANLGIMDEMTDPAMRELAHDRVARAYESRIVATLRADSTRGVTSDARSLLRHAPGRGRAWLYVVAGVLPIGAIRLARRLYRSARAAAAPVR